MPEIDNIKLIQEVADDVVKVGKFYLRGETVPPAIPLDEQERVNRRWRESVLSFGSFTIKLLQEPVIAQVLLGDKDHYTIYSSFQHEDDNRTLKWREYIDLRRTPNSDLAIILEKFQRKYVGKGQAEGVIEKYKADLTETHPETEGHNWEFETQQSDMDKVPGSYLNITASKVFTSSDLVVNELTFLRYMIGFSYFHSSHDGLWGTFRKLRQRIDEQTLTAEEAERLTKTAEICESGFQQLSDLYLTTPKGKQI